MEKLRTQIKNNRITNAYIFEGENSEYNLEKAKEFASMIFKSKKIDVNLDQNPDFFIINKDGDTIKLEDVREVIKSVYLCPNNGKVKIFIFNNSQNLRVESSNALLKTIEEPSPYSYIIFTATNAYSLLPTIRSRCQIIKIDNKKEIINIDTNLLYEVLTNIMCGKLEYFYKNKSFFDHAKQYKEELLDAIILFLKNILYYKYINDYKKDQDYYVKKLDTLSFDNIEKLIDITEKIKSSFKINANYDLSIEKLIFYLYRKAR